MFTCTCPLLVASELAGLIVLLALIGFSTTVVAALLFSVGDLFTFINKNELSISWFYETICVEFLNPNQMKNYYFVYLLATLTYVQQLHSLMKPALRRSTTLGKRVMSLTRIGPSLLFKGNPFAISNSSGYK